MDIQFNQVGDFLHAWLDEPVEGVILHQPADLICQAGGYFVRCVRGQDRKGQALSAAQESVVEGVDRYRWGGFQQSPAIDQKSRKQGESCQEESSDQG